MNYDLKTINEYTNKINIMEVCGTHTVAISKFGFRSAFNKNINLISGPGCPVCVTPQYYIDYIYDLSLNKEIIICTYGDMIRVPGRTPDRTLEGARALGANVKMVYSIMDSLNVAVENPDKKIVFLAVGFETTTAHTAVAIKEAEAGNIKNFYVLSMHKLVEPVMRTLLENKELQIHGFLCPGHVAAILGQDGFMFLNEYKSIGVIAGFEAQDIINAVGTIIDMKKNGETGVKNCYSRLVSKEGNKVALNLINEVFHAETDYWRGIGPIKDSSLKLKDKYKKYDIEQIYPVDRSHVNNSTGCQCGEVLIGKIKPDQCRLFKKVCSPENPVGPCMVSSEGSCGAYYKYF